MPPLHRGLRRSSFGNVEKRFFETYLNIIFFATFQEHSNNFEIEDNEAFRKDVLMEGQVSMSEQHYADTYDYRYYREDSTNNDWSAGYLKLGIYRDIQPNAQNNPSEFSFLPTALE